MATLPQSNNEIDRANARVDDDRTLLLREHLDALEKQRSDFHDPQVKEDLAVHLSKLHILHNMERELRDANVHSVDLRTWDLSKDPTVQDRTMGDLYPVIKHLEERGVEVKYTATASIERQREIEQSPSYGFGV